MEIIRKDELQEILDAVNANLYGKFLITGVAGSGKTFLLTDNKKQNELNLLFRVNETDNGM